MLFQFVIMAEVSPEPNLPSGYDDEFVEPVNVDLRCGICRLPMRDPMITRCGHHFCRECIEEHLRRYCDLCRDISRMVFLVILIVNSYSASLTVTNSCKFYRNLKSFSDHHRKALMARKFCFAASFRRYISIA